MDITGTRVERYAKMVLVAHKLKMFRRIIPFWCDRFKFQNNMHYLSMKKLKVIERLKPLNQMGTIDGQSGWMLHVANRFQPNAVKVWRNGGYITEASALLPPVSPYEELTKRGAGQNITSMLLLRGILVPIDNDGAAGNILKIRLAADYKRKWLMLVGDGLTQIRIKSFVDEINKSCYDFGEQQEALAMIKEALGQVINVTGDLHGGLFHFLSATYSLFYPCLIQPLQQLLGWKRICGSDVTKCYQQAAGLTSMIADELERQFLAAYFEDVCDNNELFQRLQSTEDEKAFAILIAEGYLDWLDEKRSSTTDEVFRMAINFMQMMNLLALNTGDAIYD